MHLTMASPAHRRTHGPSRNGAKRSFLGWLLFGLFSLSSVAQAQTVTYSYDAGTNGFGRLTGVSDGSGTVAFSYDKMGRIVRSDKVVDGTTYTTQTSYDTIGRVQSVGYPDSSVVYYSYNGPVLNQVYDATTTYARYSGYNALGQPSAVTFGNTVTTAYTYSNSANTTCPQDTFRLCTIKTNKATATYQNLQYNYDSAGNVASITDTINGNQSFVYDELNRLTTATGPYGTGGATATLSYAYDPIGNMTSNSQLGTYTYPASGATSVHPHAVTMAGTNSYTYDNNGNMLTGAGKTMAYDPYNRLLSVAVGTTTTSFVYDGDGGRVKKTVGTSTTVYIGQLYECAGSSCSKYIFAGRQRIALKMVGSTEVHYYHTDHLGSSSVVTKADGSKEQSLAYYPYGQTRLNTGSIDVHHKFTGQELDDSTGLYFYRARYYDAVLGRFISADTVIQSLRNPQSLNRYSYTVNNPLRLIDPTGHDSYDLSWLFAEEDFSWLFSGDYSGGYSGPYSSDYYSGSYSQDYYSGGSYSSSSSSYNSSTTLTNAQLSQTYVSSFTSFTGIFQGGFASSGVNGDYDSSAPRESLVAPVYEQLQRAGNLAVMYNSGEFEQGLTDATLASMNGMQVNLVGYSWGGEMAVEVANGLNNLPIGSVPINFLFTIDAVCTESNCTTIPGNVGYNFNFFQSSGVLHGAQNSPAYLSPANVQNYYLGNTTHSTIIDATLASTIVQTIVTNDPTIPMSVYGTP